MLRVPLRQHREILGDVVRRLAGQPGATTLTVLVLGAALALPAALLVVTDNLERLTGRFEAPGELGVYLEPGREGRREELARRLRTGPGVASVTYVSPREALDEASRLLELGDALEGLPGNPLPGSFRVTLDPGSRSPARMAALADTIRQWPAIDQVRYDRQWVERFRAGVSFLRRVGAVTGVLLGAVVVLIIGNTIRLAVAARRQEIEVVKMIGGTDAFVRLPFLYQGWLQGLAGALLAGVLVAGAVAVLDGAAAQLAARYGARFSLAGPGLRYFAGLAVLGSGLGWLGSRMAVGRHLREIEPR